MSIFTKDVDLFILACEKPRLFVQSSRYETVCAFIDGCAMGPRDEYLRGFRYWLSSQGDEWTEAPWWAIVRRQLFPGADPCGTLTDEQSDTALQSLKMLLEQYKVVLEDCGLDGVYYKYWMWLRQIGSKAAPTWLDRIDEELAAQLAERKRKRKKRR